MRVLPRSLSDLDGRAQERAYQNQRCRALVLDRVGPLGHVAALAVAAVVFAVEVDLLIDLQRRQEGARPLSRAARGSAQSLKLVQL